MKTIISASRRTDIPAFYWKWFEKCIRNNYVEVSNPKFPDKKNKIDLSKENIHSIVLWSKNLRNILYNSDFLNDYNLYFQYTITGYSNKMEPNVPTYKQSIETLKGLLNKFKAEQFNIRFDPVIISTVGESNPTYNNPKLARLNMFDKLCNDLQLIGMSNCRVTTSYISIYGNTEQNLKNANIDYYPLSKEEQFSFIKDMANIAKSYNRDIYICSNDRFLEAGLDNVKKGHYIDGKLLDNLFGKCTKAKDTGQRLECGCVKSIDIGAYQYLGNTNILGQPCGHKCAYCYATKIF